MNAPKITIFVVLIAAVVGSITYLNSQKAVRGGGSEVVTVIPRPPAERPIEEVLNTTDEILQEKNTAPDTVPVPAKKNTLAQDKSKKYELAKEITTPDGFINTDGKPVTIGEFIGKKVVLIDFWTYSCINCQRTTPYLNAWYERYKDRGLVIFGIHTPEFEFEKIYQNVLEATKRVGIKFPVVLDNDYSTWTAYKNRYWPRKYLIDIDGYIVYDHLGEGAYEETEKRIQEALEERSKALGIAEDVKDETVFLEDARAPSRGNVGSPEIYFGAARNERLGNGIIGTRGVQNLTEPKNISPNTLYLDGQWDITDEYVENRGPAKIIFRYKAQYVYIVASAENAVRAKILVDGQVIETPGTDVDEDGFVTIQKDQLYTLVAGLTSEEHTLEIVMENPGLRAFTFTFG
ncbi:MAG: Thiol-disulfide isomerase [Parcubacteria group bacterium Greene0416_79]|nr:MAG: Thiol-disulfide isomerase [Parcubacteria group bacterium Greene0416_79]